MMDQREQEPCRSKLKEKSTQDKTGKGSKKMDHLN
jgi:hypothetical protein